MPDLSPLSALVREQVRDEHRSFSQTISNPATSPAERAEAYGRLGDLLFAATYSDAAEVCYLHAQALAPTEMRWPYSLGHVYLLKGDRSKASASFQRALELRPADLPALVWLGETILDDGRPDAAGQVFQKALAVAPGSAAAHFGAGRAALATQAYPEAVQYFERTLALEERASAVHYPLAMAYRAMGQREKAEAHLRRRGSAGPSLPDPLRPAADLLKSPAVHEADGIRALRNGDSAAAVAAFRRALEFRPDDPALGHRLGTALYAAGDVAGAVKVFEDVARRSPTFVKAHVSLGVILNLNGRYQEAIGRFTTGIAADPAFPEGHLGLGRGAAHVRTARVLPAALSSAQLRWTRALRRRGSAVHRRSSVSDGARRRSTGWPTRARCILVGRSWPSLAREHGGDGGSGLTRRHGATETLGNGRDQPLRGRDVRRARQHNWCPGPQLRLHRLPDIAQAGKPAAGRAAIRRWAIGLNTPWPPLLRSV